MSPGVSAEACEGAARTAGGPLGDAAGAVEDDDDDDARLATGDDGVVGASGGIGGAVLGPPQPALTTPAEANASAPTMLLWARRMPAPYQTVPAHHRRVAEEERATCDSGRGASPRGRFFYPFEAGDTASLSGWRD